MRNVLGLNKCILTASRIISTVAVSTSIYFSVIYLTVKFAEKVSIQLHGKIM